MAAFVILRQVFFIFITLELLSKHKRLAKTCKTSRGGRLIKTRHKETYSSESTQTNFTTP